MGKKKSKGKKKITGRLDKHHRGFGFVIRDDGVKPDIYIKEKNQKNAMDDDRVEVKVISKWERAKPEGRVTEILERNSKETIGTYKEKKSWSGVLPIGSNSEKIDIVKNDLSEESKDGDRVYVHLDRMPTGRKNALGKIVKNLGPAGTYETEIETTLIRNEIKKEFSSDIKKELKDIPDSIKDLNKEDREDLRALNCFTIDPEDAKDFDDAVSIEETEKGYTLGVHIADVSYFIPEGSSLDKEAFDRGTSVYLVDRVIPMLPEEISNNICSLKPNEDRFAVTVFMYLDKKGKVKDYRFTRSIIRNKCRFSYDEVDDILEGNYYTDKKLSDDLELMVNLAKQLKERREERGSIDFEFPEININLKGNGEVKTIERKERTISHRLIEEFMILTNEVIAGHMFKNDIPSLYRVHDKPMGKKLESFRNFIKLFGFTLPEDEKITSQHLQTILDKIRESKEEVVITTMMLRSLQQALYSDENRQHFALASEHYTHFTSPIRRYPDLIVHRILTDLIEEGEIRPGRKRQYKKKLGKWGDQLSEKERAAERAELESQELKIMEFMEDRIGDEFLGIVSGITSFGIFVELPMGLEGLIRVEDLKDYYIFSEDEMVMRGKRTGKEFKIGEEVSVQLARVDLEEREVDFTPA